MSNLETRQAARSEEAPKNVVEGPCIILASEEPGHPYMPPPLKDRQEERSGTSLKPAPGGEPKSRCTMREHAAFSGTLIRKWSIILALSVVFTSCSTREKTFILSSTQHPNQPFYARGCLSVNLGAQAHFAEFEWRHQLEHDQVALRAPMGNTIAEIIRDANSVTLLAAGQVWQARDVETLTKHTLGWPLPLSALIWWIRGMSDPTSASQLQPDGELLQQGWRMRFVRAIGAETPYPSRIDLTREGVKIRFAIRDWR